jgi:phospholipid/cholesterol/gamma-HCH transport system substrate-binding protein
MSVMERSPAGIGAIVLAIIVVTTVGALFADRGMLVDSFAVEVELSSAGGIRPGDTVMVAGMRAGDVRDLRLDGGMVVAGVRIEGHRLPADSGARVRSRTVLGNEVLEILPGTAETVVAEGDRIPLERTNVALDVVAVADRAEDLLSAVDTGGLDRVLAALTDVTIDQRGQVAALTDGATRLSNVVTRKDEEIRTVLDALRRVAAAANDRDTELLAAFDGFDTTLASLATRRDDIRLLVRETAGTAASAAALVEDERAHIDAIMTELHATTAVLGRHQLDLAEALAYSGDSISGFASVGFNGPQPVPWANILVTSYGPIGIDYIGGCGGVLDQALDEILGPDPRSCAELDNQVPLPEEEERDAALPGEGEPVLTPDPADEAEPAEVYVPGVGAIAGRALRVLP